MSEHKIKANEYSRESFIIRHWMREHSTETVEPEFKFTIVSAHKDALSRQIKEAVLIKDIGNLNMKQ